MAVSPMPLVNCFAFSYKFSISGEYGWSVYWSQWHGNTKPALRFVHGKWKKHKKIFLVFLILLLLFFIFMEQCKPSFREAEHFVCLSFRKQAYLWVGYIWLKYWDVEPLSLSSRIRETVSGVGSVAIRGYHGTRKLGRNSGNCFLKLGAFCHINA